MWIGCLNETAIVAATVAVGVFDPTAEGVKVVGAVPQGFPTPGVPDFGGDDLSRLQIAAAGMASVTLADEESGVTDADPAWTNEPRGGIRRTAPPLTDGSRHRNVNGVLERERPSQRRTLAVETP